MTYVTYSTGSAVKVTPEDRAVDVLHYLTTGHLLGGRSLDGVTWEDDKEYLKLMEKRSKAWAHSMRGSK